MLSKDKRRLLWAKFRHPLAGIFSFLSTVIGILGGGAALISGVIDSQTTKDWILSSALAAIAICALLALTFREFQLNEQRKFASTLNHQRSASELLFNLDSFLRENIKAAQAGSPKNDALPRARKLIEEILTKYSEIYSIWTATRCRFCVKLIDAIDKENDEPIGPDDLLVFTLARDSLSAQENLKDDRKRTELHFDTLNSNSDFLSLWDKEINDGGFFLSNDLTDEDSYNTSSLKFKRTVSGNPTKYKQEPWPLWYRSTIVWPIRQEQRDDLDIEEETCLGFLAVDSAIPGVFNSDQHPMLGKILANSLYPPIDLYTKLQSMIDDRSNRSEHV